MAVSPYWSTSAQMALGTRKVRLRWVVDNSQNWPGPDWFELPDPIKVTGRYYYRGVWHDLDFGTAAQAGDGWIEFDVVAPRRGVEVEVRVAVGLEAWWFARLVVTVPSVVTDDGRNATPLEFEVPGAPFQPNWSATPGGEVTAAAVNAAIAAAIAGLPAAVSQAQVEATVAAAIAALPPTGVSQAEVDAAIAAAVAQGLTQDQIDAIIAAIPDSPVTLEQITALQNTKADLANIASTVATDIAASDPSVLSNWMRLFITSPDFQYELANLPSSGITIVNEVLPEPPPFGDKTPADYQNIWNRTLPGRYLYVGPVDSPESDPALLTLGRDASGSVTYLQVQRASGTQWYTLRDGANAGSTIVQITDGSTTVLVADGQGKPFYSPQEPVGASLDGVYVHDEQLPRIDSGITPGELIDIWKPYGAGLHLFRRQGESNLAVISVMEYPDGTQVNLRVMAMDSQVTGVLRSWENSESLLWVQQALAFISLRSDGASKPFTPTSMTDLAALNPADVEGKADARDTILTGDVCLDGATIDALRLRLKDGTKSVVLRGYGTGTQEPGLYLWGADGKIIGRVVTAADLNDMPQIAAAGMQDTVRAATAMTELLTPGEWVNLKLAAGTAADGVAQYRHNAGRIELRGVIAFPNRSAYLASIATIPVEARPDVDATMPAAMWESGVASRSGYLSAYKNGSLNLSPLGTVNRVSLAGIWWPEPGFTGPQLTRPAPAEDE